MIYALLQTLNLILNLIWWVFLIMIIMSWLISFNVINTRNQFVASVWRVLNQITDPILKPIRRVVPPMGGLDLSPLIVFIIIFFLQSLIGYYAARAAIGAL
ncbi:MAG: YggT family protein [Devosia sp.]|nr:YggT family protein [Devosia sp.]